MLDTIMAELKPIDEYKLLNIQRRTLEFIFAKIVDPDNLIDW